MGALMSEQWRSVVGYEGSYEVSDLGQVRAVERLGSRRFYPYPARLLKPQRRVGGYLATMLSRDGKRGYMIHRLVADAFLPKPPGWAPSWEVHHVNGIRDDNRAVNLQWLSVSANRQGRRKPRRSWDILREERDQYRDLALLLLTLWWAK